VNLTKRYEAVWDRVLDELHASGDWAAPTRADRLLMFGALNWIAHWYRPSGALGIGELADEAVRFFLRTPRPRKRLRPARTRGRRAAP
jgi:hypothetical protein